MVMSGSLRCAYGFFTALRRSLTATCQPMCSGAPDRLMYARTHGAKMPPAPMLPLLPPPRPHCALPSACFSHATASTRLKRPPFTASVATLAVEHPTLPAVCTRSIGLPLAPSASARNSSGCITPSKMSGALPITSASMSPQSRPASSSARLAASRTRPGMETSVRAFEYLVWPMPMTPGGWPVMLGILPGCRRGSVGGLARGGVREHAVAALLGDLPGGLDDAHETGDHHRVGGERAARRVDLHAVAEAERVAHHDLLRRERRGELGDLAPGPSRARRPRPRAWSTATR